LQELAENNEYFSIIDYYTSNKMLVGTSPVAIFEARGNHCKITSCNYVTEFYSDPWTEIRYFLRDLWKSKNKLTGATGYISYDAGRLLEPSTIKKEHTPNVPDILLMFFNKLSWQSGEVILNKSKKCNLKNSVKNLPRLSLTYKVGMNDYIKKIVKIKKYIEDGEVYQVNLSHMLEYDFTGSAFDLYQIFRHIAKPNFGAFLNLGKIKVLSLSPERFIRIKEGVIETFPIKGTMPRSKNKIEDLRLRNKLKHSSKDKAEHLMIVDLLRNDLGKVCEYGSVRVGKLFSIKSYETVHHMITRIYGSLRPDVDAVDIFKATFPGGSVTGAPKIRAMQIIDELEGYSRGIYTGAIGYILSDGSMDFNVAIRTMTIFENKAYYPVGGGIVYDSDPVQEYRETETKAEIINKTMEVINHARLLLP